MSTITREQAKDLRNAFQCWQQDYDPEEDKEQYDMFGLGVVAMDALLASLEAEPRGYIDAGTPDDGINILTENKLLKTDIALYTAPPAPVSVPDAMEMDDDFDSAFEHGKAVGWNACRAAMLQGADGNSPVIQDGWVMVPVEPTTEMQSAAAGAIRFDTTPINKLWTGNAVYRAMLAAAPQQEVKS